MAQILIIEDEIMVRDVVTRVLTRNGHTVIEAPDGLEGAARFSFQPADLVITDLIMPGISGVEMIAALHHDFPDLKIIAMSGSIVAANYLKIARFMGAHRTLQKPFSTYELIEAVNETLGIAETSVYERA